MKKVFLGGTCNGSDWREVLIPHLKIEYFNPQLPKGVEWTDEHARTEVEMRKNCDYCLYVITPKMTGVYSIAEVIDDSNKRPERTVFCFIHRDDQYEFDSFQIKSLEKVGEMVEINGGKWVESFYDLQNILI